MDPTKTIEIINGSTQSDDEHQSKEYFFKYKNVMHSTDNNPTNEKFSTI